ncbi:MAG: diacylglycerol kinase family lipid kinase [Elusimicrobia bacterium]|nr:diacylglycerol kinase family lipid kinase [Elusimicrobiota bacterium]
MSDFEFIINPRSGVLRNTDALTQRIQSACVDSGLSFSIHITERAGHARELAEAARNAGARCVAVAGGDGTINSAACALVGSDVALGVIPSGSGNGLARELGIALDPLKALDQLLSGRTVSVDTGTINGEFFFNMAGIGIDERIGRAFNHFGKHAVRGQWPYFLLGVKELLLYSPPEMELRIGGQSHKFRPLVMAFANGRQHGGGALISPGAKLDDGLLHITVVEHQSLPYIFTYLPRLFSGRIESVPFVKTFTATEVEVLSSAELPYHVDGAERGPAKTPFTVRINPAHLKVVIPSDCSSPSLGAAA